MRPRRHRRRGQPSFTPNIIRGDFTGRLPGVRTADAVAAVQLPLYGRIAAGMPIEALRDNGHHVEVPLALLGNGDHYALEVEGDSMVDAGILSGDTVIIRKGEAAENGQIVVALVDEERGDAEAAASARQLGGAGAGQRDAQDADLPGRTGEGAGTAGGSAAAVLSGDGHPMSASDGHDLRGQKPAATD